MYLGFQKGKIKHYTAEKLDLHIYNLDKIQFTSHKYIWDEDKEEYILYDDEQKERELSLAKKNKQAENIFKCNEKRYSQEFLIILQGKECLFDSTEQTERDLMKAFMATSDGVTTYDNWVCNNYVTINLTHEDVLTVYGTMNIRITPLYAIQKQYAEQIEACTTKEEVDNININYDINLQPDYSQYTVAELKEICKIKNIKYPSNILKSDLIALLENNG